MALLGASPRDLSPLRRGIGVGFGHRPDESRGVEGASEFRLPPGQLGGRGAQERRKGGRGAGWSDRPWERENRTAGSGGLRAFKNAMSLEPPSAVCCAVSKSHTTACIQDGSGSQGKYSHPLSLVWVNSRVEIKATAARSQQKQDSGHENMSPEDRQKSPGGLWLVTGFAHTWLHLLGPRPLLETGLHFGGRH